MRKLSISVMQVTASSLLILIGAANCSITSAADLPQQQLSENFISDLTTLVENPAHHGTKPSSNMRLKQFLKLSFVFDYVGNEEGESARQQLSKELISSFNLTTAESMMINSLARSESPSLPQDEQLAELFAPGIEVDIDKRGQKIYEAAVDRMLNRVEQKHGVAERLKVENELRKNFHENAPLKATEIFEEPIVLVEDPPIEVQIVGGPPIRQNENREPKEPIERQVREPVENRGSLGFDREEKMIREIKDAIERADLD